MINTTVLQPRLLLPNSKKGKEWRKANVLYADNKMHFDRNAIRNDYREKLICYDLLNGKIHMSDILLLLNPESITAKYIPTSILHYPIINSKLLVLRGEESKRVDDFRVIVTNPNSISEIEENKKEQIFLAIKEEIENTSQSEEEFNSRIEKLNDYYTYEWLDIREVRANCLLNHYNKELNHKLIFNNGFMDAMAVGEELYLCDIVGGEPILLKLNPCSVKIYMDGYSNKVEDADMIIIQEYWNPGRVYDTFGEELTNKDLTYLEDKLLLFATGNVDSMDNWDERKGFIPVSVSTVDNMPTADDIFSDSENNEVTTFAPFDLSGNVRVLKVYWKSRRKIKKIKYYDEETGDEMYRLESLDYIANASIGEEEKSYWINEAWEGIKIGEEIFVNIRPRPILYNRLSNPSRCHFGIIGTIYNLNDDKPFSLVQMAKPYSYLYDVIHDRLNKMMARNWGKMTRLNLALKPSTWDVDKWLYYAKTMGLYVEDGFNEGNYGKATGVLAGAMNMNSSGVIDADFGNNILLYINLLEYIKLEMSDIMGISKQREGLISNRETVGGVERATLLSSHITEYLFLLHEDTKKRVRECFLETTKGCLRGRNKKFLYILSDSSIKLVDIEGDEFAESDYGLVVDNSNGIQELLLKLETLALAALLNLTLSFSTIMKLFMSASLAEKQRFVENDERKLQEMKQQELLQAQQMLLQLLLAELQARLQEMLFKDSINLRDNETKIMVAEINSLAEMAILLLKNNLTEADLMLNEKEVLINKDKLMADMEKLDKLLLVDKDKTALLNKQFEQLLNLQKQKMLLDAELKRLALNKKTTNSK